MPAAGRADSVSPLSIAFPPEADVHWTSAGRRMAVTVSPGRGLERAIADDRAVVDGSRVTAGGRPMDRGQLTATPVDVRRTLGPGIEERWLVALDLPILVWELDAAPGTAVALEAELGREWAAADHEEFAEHAGLAGEPTASATLRLATPSGRLLLIKCDGDDSALSIVSTGAIRVLAEARGPARLTLIAAAHAADLKRTLELLARKGVNGLHAQRAQHARLLRDYGLSISTPQPALDEAFEWARLRADELGLAELATEPDLEVVLGKPNALALADPGALITGVVRGIWGAEVDPQRGALTLAPRLPRGWNRMALSRLRVGTAVLDCVLSRRGERLTLRVRRRSGPAVSVTLTLPGITIAALALDGIPLGGATARFEAAGEHEVVFDLAE